METKWHNKDRVWWANIGHRYVIEMVVFQTIIIQVDDEICVRYRLKTLDGRDDVDKIYPEEIYQLRDEWYIDDKVLFATKDEACEYLFKYMKEEADRTRRHADFLEQDIERMKNRNGIE